MFQPARDLPVDATAMVRNCRPVVGHLFERRFSTTFRWRILKTNENRIFGASRAHFHQKLKTDKELKLLLHKIIIINFLREKKTIFLFQWWFLLGNHNHQANPHVHQQHNYCLSNFWLDKGWGNPDRNIVAQTIIMLMVNVWICLIFLLIFWDTFSDIDECEKSATCPENTVCVNSAGNYDCPCRSGFKKKNNRTCENINECTLPTTSSCGENATCIDVIGSYLCACNVGFSRDGDRCININECNRKASPCHENATCTDTSGSFQCRCLIGFSGNGEECTPIDWCAEGVHSCHSEATCFSLTTLSLCTCVEGFTGNGSSCENVDECTAGTHTCATEALCYDWRGSYSCVCVDGFTGSGSNCSNVNECASGTNDCHQDSICEDLIGSFNCTCMSGYIGNGTYCSKEIIRKRKYLLSWCVTRILGRIYCNPRNFGKTTPKKKVCCRCSVRFIEVRNFSAG